MQRRPEHALLAPFVVRLHEDRGLLRAPVDEEHRARLGDTGQIEELVVLPERLLAWPLGRALQDGDRIADPFDDPGAACREFIGRKDLVAGEHRLCGEPRPEDEDQSCRRE